MSRQFTGRHMATVLIGGFGIVVAVNLFMATLAIRGFGGVVVENSYVASQKFNGWLEEARDQEAFGWTINVDRRTDGRLRIVTRNLPEGAAVSAQLRRPLGQAETLDLEFDRAAPDLHLSKAPLPAGRWIARIAITAGGRRWVDEVHVE